MNGKTIAACDAYLITWTESEAGWGQRPDGASLHLSQEDVKLYLKAYWDRMPKEVPHEYSKNDSGTGTLVTISENMYKDLKTNSVKHGIYMWQSEYRDATKKGDIKE